MRVKPIFESHFVRFQRFQGRLVSRSILRDRADRGLEGAFQKSHASFTKFFEFSEKLQAKARRNLINASKLSTLRVWIPRGFLGMLHRYPDVFFNLSSQGFIAVVGMVRRHYTVISCYISYIISTCFSATFPMQLHVASKQHRRVPHLGDLHTGKPKLCPADGRDIPF